jgi:16S rRNA (adenine1518-N6/adenine1519-N6)-dimethyltransferase
MRQVKPKKFLGQHFLKDIKIARDIADTVDVFPQLPILEVGPGMGVLTQFLVGKNRPVKVVEVDFDAVEYLRGTYPSLEDRIIEDDFLKMNLNRLFDGQPFVLTGNYPYNISSQIFFKMLDNKDLIPCCTGMIQKEVAERIAAPPGSKTYGILSILIQAWYRVEYLFTVSEQVFNPPPKVKSAVIRMTRNNVQDLGCDEKLFRQVVKTTFNQRRKMLRNSIKPLLGTDSPLLQDEIFTKRPEQLSIQQFIELTNRVEKELAIENKKKDFCEAAKECNAVSVDVFFDELNNNITKHFDKA